MGRVQKAVRQGILKIGFYYNHVITIEHKTDYQSPPAPHQMKVFHEDVIRDYPASKEHDHHKVPLEKFSIRQIPPRKGIGRQKEQDHAYRRSPSHIEKGIEKTSPKQLVIQNGPVGVQGKLHRPQNNAALNNGLAGTERTCNHIDQRIQNDKAGDKDPEKTD
jgi:hypothetical protein